MINGLCRCLQHLLVIIAFGYCSLVLADEDQPRELSFSAEGTFKIVQFADIHLSDLEGRSKDDTADQKRQRALELKTELLSEMIRVLEIENPDFVVFTGDNVVTRNDPFAFWTSLVSPLVQRTIPWAVVLGNHDDEWTGKTRQELMSFLSTLPYSMALPGEESLGLGGNYVCAVHAADGGKAKAALYFLDSGAYAAKKMGGGYSWVTPAQIAWFRSTDQSLAAANGNKPLPSLLFLHIPIPEYVSSGVISGKIGNETEGVSCPRINSGLFAALLESRTVMGVFCGHDHNNDYALGRLGVCLAYGRKTGPFSYHKLQYTGARVILLREGVAGFSSWIRNEEGGEEFRFIFPDDFTATKLK